MATSSEGGRHVVGWFKNATLFRERQIHKKFPSKQHRLDKVTDFRVRTRAQDAYLIPEDQRLTRMPHGKGWMGQVQWWVPPSNPSATHKEFMKNVRLLLNNSPVETRVQHRTKPGRSNRGGTAAFSSYTRYIQSAEIEVSPKHDLLHRKFCKYLKSRGLAEMAPDINAIDLVYKTKDDEIVVCELKPCTESDARFAIRIALGQLCDYWQLTKMRPSKKLIVLGAKPSDIDLQLAISNGAGVAYPEQSGFDLQWPLIP